MDTERQLPRAKPRARRPRLARPISLGLVALGIVVAHCSMRPAATRLEAAVRAPDAPAIGASRLKATAVSRPTAARHEAGDPGSTLAGRVETRFGEAIEGAQVCVAEGASTHPTATPCELTDANGRFVLRYPGAATAATLLASRSGYLPLTRRATPSPRGTTVVLVMHEGGSHIRGSVVDALGGPIAGAWLSGTGVGDASSVVGLSDSSGAFQLDVSPGRQVVVVRADGYSQQQLELLAPSDGVAFVLTAASSIRGRVIADGSLEPVANVSVSAHSVSGPLMTPRNERTREDGTFSIEDLSPGAYSLEAVSGEWRSDELRVALGLADVNEPVVLTVHKASRVRATVLSNGEPCGAGGAELKGPLRAYAAVADGGQVLFDAVPTGRYEVGLWCEGALAQTVALDVDQAEVTRVWDLDRGLAVTGVILTADGTAASGVTVEVKPTADNRTGVGARCTTDDRGEFSCSGLAAGNYVCAVGPGIPPRSDSVPVVVSETSTPRVTLRMHEEATLRVRLEGLERYNRSSLVLIAVRSDSEAVSGEWQEGSILFSSLALGHYEISLASAPLESPQGVELTRAGQLFEMSMTLPEPHSLSGRVVDADGQGVPDTWVRVLGSGLRGRLLEPVLTDATGNFSLSGLAPGRYDIEASNGQGDGRLEDVASDASAVLVRLRGPSLSN